ncbi:MAG: hypothetical protein HW405_587 [Candidatus Berkelbacteria bacterium]|nr:hypothetical protein [Candidatus Berkelbacteria bacterium]
MNENYYNNDHINSQLGKENICFKTADLALASAINLFQPLESLDRTDSRKVLFIFPNNEQTEKIVDSYWKRQLKVEPLDYFNSLRSIKARLHER